jgi:hypothetical protein
MGLGQEFVAHFEVRSRAKSSILFRCGDFPSVAPTSPRKDDALIEVRAILMPSEHRVIFHFDSVIFQGLHQAESPPLPVKLLVIPFMTWAHQQYAKALVEGGVQNVMGIMN